MNSQLTFSIQSLGIQIISRLKQHTNSINTFTCALARLVACRRCCCCCWCFSYGKTSFSLGNLIRSVASSMNTQVELTQLINFYESIKNDVGTGKRSFQIAIEEVESNVLWRNRNYKILEDWIHEQRSNPSVLNGPKRVSVSY